MSEWGREKRMKSKGFYTLQGCAWTIGHAEIWCVPSWSFFSKFITLVILHVIRLITPFSTRQRLGHKISTFITTRINISTHQHDPITTAKNNEVERQLGARDAHVGKFFHLFFCFSKFTTRLGLWNENHDNDQQPPLSHHIVPTPCICEPSDCDVSFFFFFCNTINLSP